MSYPIFFCLVFLLGILTVAALAFDAWQRHQP